MSVHHTRLKLVLLPSSAAASPARAIDLSFLPARLQAAAQAWPSLVTTSPETGTLSLYIDSRLLWAASVICAALMLMLVYRLNRGAWSLLRRLLGRSRSGNASPPQVLPPSSWLSEKQTLTPFTSSPWPLAAENSGAVVLEIPSDTLDSSSASGEDDSDGAGGDRDRHYRSRSYCYPNSGSGGVNTEAALPLRPVGGRSSSFSQVPSVQERAARRRRSLFAMPRLAVRKRRSANMVLDGYEEV